MKKLILALFLLSSPAYAYYEPIQKLRPSAEKTLPTKLVILPYSKKVELMLNMVNSFDADLYCLLGLGTFESNFDIKELAKLNKDIKADLIVLTRVPRSEVYVLETGKFVKSSIMEKYGNADAALFLAVKGRMEVGCE